MKEFIKKHRVKLLIGILALLIVLLIVGLAACRNDAKQETEQRNESSFLSSEPEKSGTGSGFEATSADPKPTAASKATVTPRPVNSKEENATATAAPKPTAKPTAAPTAKPTAAPTAKPTTAPTSAPTAAPTPKTEQVWVVDVPGHYETVTETKEVWVEEQGHYEQEKVGIMAPVYKCNQCGTTTNSEEAMWDHEGDLSTCWSYTYMGDVAVDFYYEDVWVVDVPGHNETQTVETEVWVEEVGHYETVTVE